MTHHTLTHAPYGPDPLPFELCAPDGLRDNVDPELDRCGQNAEDVDVDARQGSLDGIVDDVRRGAENGYVKGLPIELGLAEATIDCRGKLL